MRAYQESVARCISYTAGVPPVAAALLIAFGRVGCAEDGQRSRSYRPKRFFLKLLQRNGTADPLEG